MRMFDFDLKGKFVGYLLTYGLNDNLVGKKVLSSDNYDSLMKEFSEYKKTLNLFRQIVEFDIIENKNRTETLKYIDKRVNIAIKELKASN